MAKFGGSLSNFATTTSVKTAQMVWSLPVSALNHRVEVVELLMTGSGAGAVGDIPIQATAAFATATTSGIGGTAINAEAMRTSTNTAQCLTNNFTTEPSYATTSFPVLFGFNSRGGNKFSVPQGEGILIDSGTTFGRLGWRAQAQSGTPGVDSEVQYWSD